MRTTNPALPWPSPHTLLYHEWLQIIGRRPDTDERQFLMTFVFRFARRPERGCHALSLAACATAALTPVLAGAQLKPPAGKPTILPEVVVSATRVEEDSFELPVSIDRVDGSVIREDKPQVNLSESLNRVPGVVVQNRQNYAQDLQISSRGFGSRSTFGVRGLRLIADGIPATMPDGQGQAATFSLGSADRIEVMRGPFSSLYGNAAGGVIQIFTADGPPEPTLSGRPLRRQLRYLQAGCPARRHQRTPQLHRRSLAVRHQRLSRPQLGATRSTQRQGQVQRGQSRCLDPGRERPGPAGYRRSARLDRRTGCAGPASGRDERHSLQHAQEHLPGPARPDIRGFIVGIQSH